MPKTTPPVVTDLVQEVGKLTPKRIAIVAAAAVIGGVATSLLLNKFSSSDEDATPESTEA